MRPAASTAVASIISRPAPPTASEPRCSKCHSLALPSSALYWHIGETTMRLASVSSRKAIGVNSGLGIAQAVLQKIGALLYRHGGGRRDSPHPGGKGPRVGVGGAGRTPPRPVEGGR